MHPTERYPLDFDAYDRGDSISAVVVRRAIENEPGFTEHKYSMYQVRLGQMLSNHLTNKNGGNLVTVRCEGMGLRVLTHDQQFDYISEVMDTARRKVFLALRTTQGIKVDMLSDDRRKNLDRVQILAAFRAQQMMKRPPPQLTNGAEDDQ